MTEVADLEEVALTAIAGRLCARFPDVSPAVVRDTLRTTYARFDGRPIRDFVPLLVERQTAQLLRGVARQPPTEPPST